jgi:cobalt-precorrin-7 (C5)-methyltransferase
MSKLYLVGTGPGSMEYLTLKALEVVKSVDILVGSRRALKLFGDFNGERVELGARNVDTALKKAVREVSSGKNVAILSTGDPGFSGTLKPILKLIKNMEINLEVVPGVSSIQIASARLKLPWDDSDIVTMHGKGNSLDVLKLLDNGKPTLILPNRSVDELAAFLIKNGVKPSRKVAVCEKLSYPDERIIKTTLNKVLGMEFSYMCVVVVY